MECHILGQCRKYFSLYAKATSENSTSIVSATSSYLIKDPLCMVGFCRLWHLCVDMFTIMAHHLGKRSRISSHGTLACERRKQTSLWAQTKLQIPSCIIKTYLYFFCRDENEWWIFPVALFLCKVLQSQLVNWHVANLEIQDYSLYSDDSELFWQSWDTNQTIINTKQGGGSSFLFERRLLVCAQADSKIFQVNIANS